jgi:hypothetical protein
MKRQLYSDLPRTAEPTGKSNREEREKGRALPTLEDFANRSGYIHMQAICRDVQLLE